MPYTEMGTTWTKLLLITGHARRDPTFQFTSLAHLLNAEYLGDCYRQLDKHKAVGIDDVTWEDYGRNLEENLRNLETRLKRKTYWPAASKRVYIPKNEHETRPLGISTLENKIVERAVMKILESIYEQDFLECSYGFRPHRNCHQALKALNDAIMWQPVNHIVEADVKGFFDNVPHKELQKFLRIRIGDTALLELIEKFLKAGFVDKGELVASESGTPQGSILSPMLSNIFLHYVLDLWFEETVKRHVRGYCELIRYADDYVCVARYAEDAARIERALKNRFNKYGLEIHPDKSRKISFGRFEQTNAASQSRKPNTFDFLGFTLYCTKTLKGNFRPGFKTSQKKFRKRCKEVNEWLRTIRNQVKTVEWWETVKAKLRGHYQYYGVSGNYRSLALFYKITLRAVHKWLNRRSQKRKTSWEKFKQYLDAFPLPTPTIKYNLYMSKQTGS